MMNNSNNFLYLIWKDPNSRTNYIVGKLTRNEKYTFEYCEEFMEAQTKGWRYLDAFPQCKVYENEKMFPLFSSRLPDRKRRDIKQILEKYGMSEFDEFELLRKSGARLPIDTYEFIDPIFENNTPIQREFFVTGIRYNAECEGKLCSQLEEHISLGDMLALKAEPGNEFDPNAIFVETLKGHKVGYVPRYYNKGILSRMKSGMTYSCEVIELLFEGNCSECVKVKLRIPANEW